jgi:two-component system, NarL family, response regulator DevR
VIRVLICDDHHVLRRALTLLVDQHDDLSVAAAVGIGDAREHATGHAFDVAVVHVDAEEPALSLARWLRGRSPSIPVLIVASVASDHLLVAGHEAGVAAVLAQHQGPDDLVDAVRSAAAGRSLIDPDAVAGAIDRMERDGFAPWSALDDTDRQIMTFVADGLTDREIGQRLYLSQQTIRNRVSRLLTVFHRSNRTQLAVLMSSRRGMCRCTGADTPRHAAL